MKINHTLHVSYNNACTYIVHTFTYVRLNVVYTCGILKYINVSMQGFSVRSNQTPCLNIITILPFVFPLSDFSCAAFMQE